MYGDTLVMRRRAAQLREQGEDIRTMAEQLVTRSDEVVWTGRAADLGECDRLTESIAGIELRASSLVADARTRVARLQSSTDEDAVRPTATREDQALVAFAPPPPGHKDWLDVELPGL